MIINFYNPRGLDDDGKLTSLEGDKDVTQTIIVKCAGITVTWGSTLTINDPQNWQRLESAFDDAFIVDDISKVIKLYFAQGVFEGAISINGIYYADFAIVEG